MSCRCDIGLQNTDIKCTEFKINTKSVKFYHETKEVFDLYGNFMGYAELKDGELIFNK
jgi:hypothetical protein